MGVTCHTSNAMPNTTPATRRSIELEPLTPADFAAVAELAHRIWHAHYSSIITHEQIDYMLGNRFAADGLARYVGAADRWMELLRVDGVLVGYCSWSLTAQPAEMKLEQLYVVPELHGQGLGKRMMQRIEIDARAHGCRSLVLTVNKHNQRSIEVYLHSGFVVREEAVFDIGRGYVMDDYVMSLDLQ